MSVMVGIKFPLDFFPGDTFVAPSGISATYLDAFNLMLGGIPLEIAYKVEDSEGITFYVKNNQVTNQGS